MPFAPASSASVAAPPDGGRSYRRYHHRLPASVTAENGSKHWIAELKDVSVVALCLVLPAGEGPTLRQGSRARIHIEQADNAPLQVGGSVLYTLLAEDGSRQCVILFDRSHPEVVATRTCHTAINVIV